MSRDRTVYAVLVHLLFDELIIGSDRIDFMYKIF